MSDESNEETKEKATVLSHLAVVSFPAEHLAPWMSILRRPEIAAQIYMRTAQDAVEMLGREQWRLDHPKEADPEDEFDPEVADGAAWAFAYCAGKLASHIHDLAPSEGGIGRRQAMTLGMAQKSGVAVEPIKRTFWQKITGRGKEQEKVSGGV